MKKSEMELHAQEYHGHIEKAAIAEKKRDFEAVIKHAESSWEYMDGMIRRVSQDAAPSTLSLDGLTYVLRYAPPLFQLPAIRRMETFLRGKRRILKAWNCDSQVEVARAENLLWVSYAIWDKLEHCDRYPVEVVRQTFEKAEPAWKHVKQVWAALNVVKETSAGGVSYLELTTRLESSQQMKCPQCGFSNSQPKHLALEPIQCPHCQGICTFVLV